MMPGQGLSVFLQSPDIGNPHRGERIAAASIDPFGLRPGPARIEFDMQQTAAA